MREKTIYVIERPFGCDSLSFITTKAKIKRDFIKMPDEIRWDFCNFHEEWIYRREEEDEVGYAPLFEINTIE